MYTLILIMFGAGLGWLAATSRNQVFWDIVFGALGAIASGAVVSCLGLPLPQGYGLYSFVAALMVAVAIIYIGRFLEKIPLG